MHLDWLAGSKLWGADRQGATGSAIPFSLFAGAERGAAEGCVGTGGMWPRASLTARLGNWLGEDDELPSRRLPFGRSDTDGRAETSACC